MLGGILVLLALLVTEPARTTEEPAPRSPEPTPRKRGPKPGSKRRAKQVAAPEPAAREETPDE